MTCTVTRMSPPKETHTPPRQIRIGDDWYDFQAAIELMGGDLVGGGSERAENLRDYIAWVLRRPGATMPKRPPAEMAEQIKKRGAEIKREAEAKTAARTRKGT